MEVRKADLLAKAQLRMDSLSPALNTTPASTEGASSPESASEASPSVPCSMSSGPPSASPTVSLASTTARGQRDCVATGGEGSTLMGRCVRAALSTGVDCVLAEEYASSREVGREKGLEAVPREELERLYMEFQVPEGTGNSPGAAK
ncbi:unnamed protein product [Discosporangium mesarthrocarpum]